MGLHPGNRFGDAPAGAEIALDPLDGRVLARYPGEHAYPVSVRRQEADEVPAQTPVPPVTRIGPICSTSDQRRPERAGRRSAARRSTATAAGKTAASRQ
jgi:hypothetical protein